MGLTDLLKFKRKVKTRVVEPKVYAMCVETDCQRLIHLAVAYDFEEARAMSISYAKMTYPNKFNDTAKVSIWDTKDVAEIIEEFSDLEADASSTEDEKDEVLEAIDQMAD